LEGRQKRKTCSCLPSIESGQQLDGRRTRRMSVRAGLKAKRSGQKAVEAKQQNRSELEVVLEFTVCFKIIQLACELSLQAIQFKNF